MNPETQTVASVQFDPELGGRIVRGIAQIEADYFAATGALSEYLMQEAVAAMRKVAVAPWQIVEAGWSAQVVCPEWKMTKGVGTGDAWLELTEICDDDNDHSWIAAAVKAGATQLVIELVFRRGLQDAAEAVIRDDKAVSALSKLGFVRQEGGVSLFIPINIPAEKLALGFAQNDLTSALAPIGRALGQAIAAKAELSALVELVRAATKRK